MQSLGQLRALAGVERDLMEDRAIRFVRARATNDKKMLRSLLSGTAAFRIPGDPAFSPFFGRHAGIEAVLHFINQCHIEHQVLNQDIIDVMIDGERVAIRSRCKLRHWGTGRATDFEVCDVITFENGYITDVVAYMDTLALMETRECERD